MKRKKKEDKKESKKVEKKDNQLYWIFGVMLIILAGAIVYPFILNAINTFEYQGLEFRKEKFDQIDVYRYSYFFNDYSGQMYEYNLYLRNDPRENNVSIEGEINYPSGKYVYIGINGTGLVQCPTILRDAGTLALFLKDNLSPANIAVKSGITDENEAKALNISYVSCERRPENTVIIIQKDDETKIEKENNCHAISVASCDDLTRAIEKFEVQSIIDAKERS